MELGKLDELAVILVTMYGMSIDDIESKAIGINMFTETEFVTITMRQGVTIILPDVNASKNYVYYDTNTSEGKYKMVKDLMDNNFCEYDIAKFLDTTGKNINKILKRGGNKNV